MKTRWETPLKRINPIKIGRDTMESARGTRRGHLGSRREPDFKCRDCQIFDDFNLAKCRILLQRASPLTMKNRKKLGSASRKINAPSDRKFELRYEIFMFSSQSGDIKILNPRLARKHEMTKRASALSVTKYLQKNCVAEKSKFVVRKLSTKFLR